MSELSPELARPAVPGRLLSLVRKELIRPDRAVFAGDDAFRFRHLLIRDAAYEAMPKEARAELHERFAAWLAERAGDRLSEYEEVLGYHLEQACRYRRELSLSDERTESLARRAAQRLAAAGRRASGRGDLHAAANLLLRAASVLPREAPERLPLALDLPRPLIESGRFAEAESLLSELAELASTHGDALAEARAAAALMLVRESTTPEGWPGLAEVEAERLEPIFEQAGDERSLAAAWVLRRQVHWWRAEYARVLETSERLRSLARRIGDAGLEADSTHFNLSAYAWGPMEVVEGIRRCEELLAGAGGDLQAQLHTVQGLAPLMAMAGRFAEARALIDRAQLIDGELGSAPLRAASIDEKLGMVESLAGDHEAAEGAQRREYETFEALGEKSFLSTCAAYLAASVYEQGGYDAAEKLTQVSEDLAGREDVPSQIGWRVTRARVLVRRGDPDGERLAREAVALAEKTDATYVHGGAELALCEVLRLAGRTEEAAAAAERALAFYESKGIVPLVERTRVLIADLAKA